MEDRPLPQPGNLYRQWNGEIAQIMGTAEWRQYKSTDKIWCNAKHPSGEASLSAIPILKDGSLTYIHGEVRGPLVIYACSGDLWALPLPEFMQIISDPDGEGTNHHRFEKMPDNFWDTPVGRGDQGSFSDLMREV